MATTIKLKNGSGAPLAGDLVQGEPAFDLTNKRLYTEDSGGTVIEVGTNPTSLTTGTFTSTGIDDNATSTAITIDASERVGIKTTSLNANLEISGNTTTGGEDVVQWNNSSGVNKGMLQLSSTGGGQIQLRDAGNTVDVQISSTTDSYFNGGNVGIGTTTPDNKFHVVSGSAGEVAQFTGEIEARGLSIRSETNTDASAHVVFNSQSGGSKGMFTFKTDGTERMRIDSNGRVGIGTSSPGTFQLAVDSGTAGNTNAEAGLYISGTRAGNVYNIVSNTQSTGGDTGSAFKFSNGGFDTGAIIVRADGTASSGDAAGYMTFHTSNNGSEDLAERMRIDSSGNLGIGTDSPTSLLSVGTLGSTSNTTIQIGSSSSTAGSLYFGDGTGSLRYRGYVQYSHADNSLAFGANGSERMRIDSSGNLLVGTTSTGGVTGGSSNGAYISGSSNSAFSRSATTNLSQIAFYNPNGFVGQISTSGSTTTYSTSSDERLKENIVDAPAGNIDDIRVRSFDWKADGSHQTYGMVAQELVDVAPEAVSQGATEDDMWGVDYSKLVPMMIKEIQDLKAEVAALKGA